MPSPASSKNLPPPPTSGSNSYGQILKSTSVIGGSAAINLLVGMAAAKAGAVFLGAEGVGLLKLYNSTLAMLRTLSSLGVNSSGVREVATAIGSGDHARLGRVVQVLRKICWATGLLGWLLAALLAYPLSLFVFNSNDYWLSIVLLGVTLLFAAISGGQVAFLQGSRRIADIAQINVYSAVFSTIVAILSYWRFGVSGIVPALVLGGAITLLVSWIFSRRVQVADHHRITWKEIIWESKHLVSLGLAFMWSGLLASLVAMLTNALIVRELGMESNGYYGAAWALSGLFASFILGAMGADFLPRLSAVQNDNPLICRLVNEQTEVGILLALPGLVATLFFAPLAIKIFYTSEFIVAAELLPWLVLGVFAKITAWPMGFVLVAKGETKLFAIVETIFNVLHLFMLACGLFVIGLIGVAAAYFVLYIFCNIIMHLINRRLISLTWNPPVWRLVAIAFLFILAGFSLPRILSSASNAIVGAALVFASCLFCARGLATRLGPQSQILRSLKRWPLMNLIIKM